MKNIIKFGILFLIVFLILSNIYVNISFADLLSDVQNAADGGWTDGMEVEDDAQSIMGGIIAAARVITAGIAVIIIFVLAIKYMMASPEGKADIRKTAITYFVGALVMFSASGILGLIQKVAI